MQRMWRKILCQAALRATKLDVYVNLRKVGRNMVLAICDCDLLGKTLQKGKLVFHISGEFYNGGKLSLEEAIRLIENSNIVNMVGKDCVERAIEKGYVHPEAVLDIGGVPHAQIIKI